MIRHFVTYDKIIFETRKKGFLMEYKKYIWVTQYVFVHTFLFPSNIENMYLYIVYIFVPFLPIKLQPNQKIFSTVPSRRLFFLTVRRVSCCQILINRKSIHQCGQLLILQLRVVAAQFWYNFISICYCCTLAECIFILSRRLQHTLGGIFDPIKNIYSESASPRESN